MRKVWILVALPALLALALAGCGGGGDGGSDVEGRVAVFMTDAFSDDYDHVWATIYRVELLNASGGAVVVFDDTAGRQVDLTTLRDAGGQRFAFLADAIVPAGSYTGARVAIGETLVLFSHGATVGQEVPVAAAIPRDAANHAVLQFAFASPRDLGGSDSETVIDFDLPRWVLVGGAVTPRLGEGSENGLHNGSRHDDEDYRGVVGALSGTAPDLTFRLNGPGGSVVVATSAATVIYNSNAAPNPVLANGKRVEVRGTFDVATRRLNATEVKIEGAGAGDDLPEVNGTASDANAAAGTFRVTVREAQEFVPTHTTINVATTASTVFRASGGVVLTKAELFALLAAGPRVEVQGTYNATTNTLTATRVKVKRGDDGPGHEQQPVEAKGTATSIVAAAGTFSLTALTEWEGFIPPGVALPVVTNANTRFRAVNGDSMTAAAFFAALAANPRVKAEGTFSAGVLVATQVRLLSASGDD